MFQSVPTSIPLQIDMGGSSMMAVSVPCDSAGREFHAADWRGSKNLAPDTVVLWAGQRHKSRELRMAPLFFSPVSRVVAASPNAAARCPPHVEQANLSSLA